MTSPFERVSESVAQGIRALDLRAQVALYASAAMALGDAYRTWSERSGAQFHGEILDRAIEQAIAFATGEASTIPRSLLAAVEANTPSEPSDAACFTAAQDCWIVADTALRGGLGEFDPADSAWYLLEPQLQATSDRLLGVSDPGSAVQEDQETRALEDPQLAAAIETLRRAVETLRVGPLTRDLLAGVSSQLVVLSP